MPSVQHIRKAVTANLGPDQRQTIIAEGRPQEHIQRKMCAHPQLVDVALNARAQVRSIHQVTCTMG